MSDPLCARATAGALLLALAGVPAQAPAAADAAWQRARVHAEQSRRAVVFCLRYADGWLAHADPVSGLLPRTLRGDAFWNARDCAADNFPFLAMTAHLTGLPHLLAAARHMLAQERALTRTPTGLPDDFVFSTQSLRPRQPAVAELLFGAAEYCKDGLLPLFEWTGHADYRERLLELLDGIVRHADTPSPAGLLPTDNLEVHGDLLQALSRVAWRSDDPRWQELAFRLGDYYLLHAPLTARPLLPLRDHGCEVIGGLSEAYVLAAHREAARRARWRAPLYELLDCIAEHGVRADGLLHEAIDPRQGVAKGKASDGWGYVLDAFATVAALDGEARFQQVVARCLASVRDVAIADTPGLGGADGAADTLEGAINLLARLPDAATSAWVDREMSRLLGLQRPDGVLEAWYGDGNSARTAWLWAMAKTAGVSVQPWRSDVSLGAERSDGTLRVVLRAEFAWRGTLRCDRARHREVLGLPFDYARINQWPEWFTVDAASEYLVQRDGEAARRVRGAELLAWPLELAAGKETRIAITAPPVAGGATGK